MNKRILVKQIKDLSHRFPVDAQTDYSSILVRGFETPPGYNLSRIDVRLELPEDYPASPPGVSPSYVYVPAKFAFPRSETERFSSPGNRKERLGLVVFRTDQLGSLPRRFDHVF